MGKRLISQRRGRGTNTFKAKLKGIDSKYLAQNDSLIKGQVINLEKETCLKCKKDINRFQQKQKR